MIISTISIIPFSAFALNASGTCGMNATYTFDSTKGVLTISGTGAMTDYAYASASPFYDVEGIKSIVVEEGITSIGDHAFHNVKKATSIKLPFSLTNIGTDSFYDCDSLKSICIPRGLAAMEAGAFYGCDALEDVAILSGLTAIPDHAFTSCANLKTIAIPQSVTSVGDYAFYGTALSKIYYQGAEANFNAITVKGANNGKFTSAAKQYYSGYCGENVRYMVTNSQTKLILSGTGATFSFDSYDPDYYSYRDTITSVEVESGVTGISAFTFYDLPKLITAILGNKVETIGGFAFKDDSALTTVSIPASVTSIADCAFDNCNNLATVNYSGTRAQWGAISIAGNNAPLSSATINCSDGIIGTVSGKCGTMVNYSITYTATTGSLSIYGTGAMTDYGRGESPFYQNSAITSVSFGPLISKIGSCAFEDCTGLTSVTIPAHIKTIGDHAFLACSGLESVELASGVQTVGFYAFSSCDNLKSVVLPNTVTTIGGGAFRSNNKLESINIPDSVTSIGDYAFFDDSKLTISASCKHPLMAGVVSENGVKWTKVHTMSPVAEVKASCLTGGNNAYYHCTACDKYFKDEAGKTETTPNAEKTAALGHDFKATVTKPTCTEGGYTTYDCTRCLYSYTDDYTDPAHTPGEPEITSFVPATYDKDGSYEEVVYCSVCGEELSRNPVTIDKLQKTSISKAKVTGIKNKTYTGKALTQKITVKLGEKTLVKNTDYKISYSKNKSVGTATVKITGIGAYEGTLTKTFKINPKGTTVTKATSPKSKQIKVTWKKQTTQTTGYQIQYAKNSSFSNAKKKTVSKNKTTTKTLTKLTSKKKYYVRIRTYKTVNGKKYYSSWSKAKSCKVK